MNKEDKKFIHEIIRSQRPADPITLCEFASKRGMKLTTKEAVKAMDEVINEDEDAAKERSRNEAHDDGYWDASNAIKGLSGDIRPPSPAFLRGLCEMAAKYAFNGGHTCEMSYREGWDKRIEEFESENPRCKTCGAPSAGGEGWDGNCGNCADKAAAKEC